MKIQRTEQGSCRAARAAVAIAHRLTPFRLDERLWHAALVDCLEQRLGYRVLMTRRQREVGQPVGGVAPWLMTQQVLQAHWRTHEQAQLAVFLSPRSQKQVWYRHRSLRIEHCSTPLGEIVAVRYVLPRSGMTRCTLFVSEMQSPQRLAEQKCMAGVLARDLIQHHQQRLLDPVGDKLEGLSPRELQTLHLVLGGRSEPAIAALLERSPHTVHTYIKSLYSHFKVSSRGELMSMFIPPLQLGASATAVEDADDARSSSTEVLPAATPFPAGDSGSSQPPPRRRVAERPAALRPMRQPLR